MLGGLRTKKQAQCINEVYKCLKDGGEFWIMENLTASLFHRFLRYLFVPWSKEWRYIKPNEFDFFLKQFREVKIESRGILSLFGRNEYQRDFLASIDDILIKFMSSIKWHTNAFIIARK